LWPVINLNSIHVKTFYERRYARNSIIPGRSPAIHEPSAIVHEETEMAVRRDWGDVGLSVVPSQLEMVAAIIDMSTHSNTNAVKKHILFLQMHHFFQ
jgi:hypothetical protein